MPDGSPEYLRPYAEAVADLGPSFDALLWKSPEAQQKRFRVIADLADPTGRVVADMGCGLADLVRSWHREGIQYGRYVGVEGIAEFTDEAARRLADEGVPEASVMTADFVSDERAFERLVREHRTDYFIFSGSLNTFAQNLAEKVLERAWRAIDREPGACLVFNFLSDRHHRGRAGAATPPAMRHDTVRWLDWAMERTGLVSFTQAYHHGHDATIAMRAGE